MEDNKSSLPSPSEKQSYKFLLDAALARKREQMMAQSNEELAQETPHEETVEEQPEESSEEVYEETEEFEEEYTDEETDDDTDEESDESEEIEEETDEDEDEEESDEESEEEAEEETSADAGDSVQERLLASENEESVQEKLLASESNAQQELDVAPAQTAEEEVTEPEPAPAAAIVVPADKNYFRIGEVAELLRVEPHVLRYWESEFSQIRPTKSGGQRVYNRKTVECLVEIRDLLYDQGFSISGARKKLKEFRHTPKPAPVAVASVPREELKELEKGLRELIRYAESNTAF